MDLALLLLRHGPGVIANDAKSPLNLGIQNKIQDLECFLVNHTDNLEIRDKDGSTPLHWAVPLGDMDIIRLLVKYGADVTAEDNHGVKVQDL